MELVNDSTFVAPEGVYSLTEDIKAPTFGTGTVMNAQQSQYPTRVSTVTIHFPGPKAAGSAGLAVLLGGTKDSKAKEKEKEKEKETDRASNSSSEHLDDQDTFASPDPVQPNDPLSPKPASPLFPPTPTQTGKKKSILRPKHNIRTTSSTFVTRLHSVEGLNRILTSKQGDVTFLFYNSGKSFFWTEIGSKTKDPLARITFSAFPTCHDVNLATASPDRIDVVIGFSTGDLVWFDPLSSRYVRLNKQGSISTSPCLSVHWVPTSHTLFFTCHADGTMILFDKEREDGTFTRILGSSAQTPKPESEASADIGHSPSDFSSDWDTLSGIIVSTPPLLAAKAGQSGSNNIHSPTGKEKPARNPVAHWKVSRRPIPDFTFSPDARYVAVISEDGYLRIIDVEHEDLIDCYASYFGALTCVAWSPDSRFILTGGQDDLVTIFSPAERRLIARCSGHSSFISALAFDPFRCDGRTYRFGSVGEDNKLILWDFSSGAIHRPKLQPGLHRFSLSSTFELVLPKRGETNDPSSPPVPDASGTGSPRYHPAPSKNEAAVLQPVLIKQLDGDMLSYLNFLRDSILSVTKTGSIKAWVRPLAPARHRHPKNAGTLSI
ncbi:WD40 repeat-like protein [Sistotremastrum niveocremeum HHB9708]|uniref:WD40 repeat-like protein n=2 Tax=Sistotremastraceae TaxID=3402574 RepID=A0A164QWB9_9AGAM|nr:WD40 repeat-like protein [Sistotremastrum niveocremeum HHB9708]KZT39258.1 WD40 repeat-like protein [Sistotremastrum suecicum HHB10207 ss-3]